MTSEQFQAKSFFAGLFDFSFTTFITLKFLRVIYIVLMVFSVIGGLVLFASLASRGGVGVLLGLILAPLVMLFYVVVARIYLELIALLFRIGENTTLLVQQGGSSPTTTGYGLPPTLT